MAAHNPATRKIQAQIAANTMWAGVADRTARTAPARAGLEARFERQVDPDGTLDPVERAKRTKNARQAHFQRMALKSAQSRARSAAARRTTTDA